MEAGVPRIKLAAVVIPIVTAPEPYVLFVRRAGHLRRNPGEIGFPGGLIESHDEDPATAALRECQEELGIAPERITIVERLPDVLTLALSVSVVPFVGKIEPPVTLWPDPSEVADVFEVPLAVILAPGAVHEGEERLPNGRVTTWQFDHHDMHVWGATGRMLHALVERYSRHPTP